MTVKLSQEFSGEAFNNQENIWRGWTSDTKVTDLRERWVLIDRSCASLMAGLMAGLTPVVWHSHETRPWGMGAGRGGGRGREEGGKENEWENEHAHFNASLSSLERIPKEDGQLRETDVYAWWQFRMLDGHPCETELYAWCQFSMVDGQLCETCSHAWWNCKMDSRVGRLCILDDSFVC